MYKIVFTSKSKKDLKRIKKRNKIDFKLVTDLINLLHELGTNGVPLSMKPHPLKGNYIGTLECHVKPDLLVIWIQIESPKIIRLIRVGSHSDLF